MFSSLRSRVPGLQTQLLRCFSASSSPSVGVIGCGNVGQAMVKNLLRGGYKVSAYDCSSRSLEALPSDVTRRNSPQQVGESADVIITALPKPSNVRAALLGDNGLMEVLKNDKIWIDHSTTDYNQTLELAAQVEAQGGGALEAPVTGGMALLHHGKMTALCGGKQEVFDVCKPIIQLSCENILYMGAIGNATITKVISNMMAAAQNVQMTESMLMAKRADINLETFWSAIKLSAGNSFVWETEAPLVFNGTYDPEFTIDLHLKDLQLGHDIARKFQVPLELNSLVEQIFQRARARYGDEVGNSIIPKMTEEILKESLQVEGYADWTYTTDTSNGALAVIHRKKGAKK